MTIQQEEDCSRDRDEMCCSILLDLVDRVYTKVLIVLSH